MDILMTILVWIARLVHLNVLYASTQQTASNAKEIEAHCQVVYA